MDGWNILRFHFSFGHGGGRAVRQDQSQRFQMQFAPAEGDVRLQPGVDRCLRKRANLGSRPFLERFAVRSGFKMARQ